MEDSTGPTLINLLAKRHRHQHDKGIDRQNPPPGIGSGLAVDQLSITVYRPEIATPVRKRKASRNCQSSSISRQRMALVMKRGQHRETADVAHPGNNGGYTDTTDDKTQEITGGADPDRAEIRQAIATGAQRWEGCSACPGR